MVLLTYINRQRTIFLLAFAPRSVDLFLCISTVENLPLSSCLIRGQVIARLHAMEWEWDGRAKQGVLNWSSVGSG